MVQPISGLVDTRGPSQERLLRLEQALLRAGGYVDDSEEGDASGCVGVAQLLLARQADRPSPTTQARPLVNDFRAAVLS